MEPPNQPTGPGIEPPKRRSRAPSRRRARTPQRPLAPGPGLEPRTRFPAPGAERARPAVRTGAGRCGPRGFMPRQPLAPPPAPPPLFIGRARPLRSATWAGPAFNVLPRPLHLQTGARPLDSQTRPRPAGAAPGPAARPLGPRPVAPAQRRRAATPSSPRSRSAARGRRGGSPVAPDTRIGPARPGNTRLSCLTPAGPSLAGPGIHLSPKPVPPAAPRGQDRAERPRRALGSPSSSSPPLLPPSPRSGGRARKAGARGRNAGSETKRRDWFSHRFPSVSLRSSHSSSAVPLWGASRHAVWPPDFPQPKRASREKPLHLASA